ncbi:hypothetical protein CBR_g51274 [Chara braunii]|uniref:CCHC-type domain-containing protein n=1 Tax=Chara braunii TaxID=69332 RepID=A0A388M860_CHABU|nr:hypothetical protein CBR_g51274 [Chara braunii]|eukprot:GBG90768.1 hypothetical protein CBR_g51274 [Chara braunii]
MNMEGLGGVGVGASNMGSAGFGGANLGAGMGPAGSMAGKSVPIPYAAQNAPFGTVTCFICGKTGHYSRNCWQTASRQRPEDDLEMKELLRRIAKRDKEEEEKKQRESEEAKKREEEERRKGEKLREAEAWEARLEATIVRILAQRKEVALISPSYPPLPPPHLSYLHTPTPSPSSSHCLPPYQPVFEIKKRSPRTKARMLHEIRSYIAESDDDSDEVKEEADKLIMVLENRKKGKKGAAVFRAASSRITRTPRKTRPSNGGDGVDALETPKKVCSADCSCEGVVDYALTQARALNELKAPDLKKICDREGIDYIVKDQVIDDIARSTRSTDRTKVARVVRANFGVDVRRRVILKIPYSSEIQTSAMRGVMVKIITASVADPAIRSLVTERMRIVTRKSKTVGGVIHKYQKVLNRRSETCSCADLRLPQHQGHVRVRLDEAIAKLGCSGDTTIGRSYDVKDMFAKLPHEDIIASVGWLINQHQRRGLLAVKKLHEVYLEVASVGPKVKLPSYNHMRTVMLNFIYLRIQKQVHPLTACWDESGCTFITDGSSDCRERPVMNFLAAGEKGAVLVATVSMTARKKTAQALAKLREQIMREIGVHRINAICTDNAEVNKKAAQLLERRTNKDIARIPWVPCAAHCCSLLLRDISKLDWVKSTVKRGHTIVKFIRNHHSTNSLMMSMDDSLTLLRPTEVRFGSVYMMLERLLNRKVVLSDLVDRKNAARWMGIRWSTTKLKSKVDLVYFTMRRDGWWTELKKVVDVSEPLYNLLRRMDRDGTSPTNLDEYDDMIERKLAHVVLTEEQRASVMDKVRDRVKMMRQPVHALAFLLDPRRRNPRWLYDRDSAIVQNAMHYLRNNLKPETLEKLVYIHWNIQLLRAANNSSANGEGYVDLWRSFFKVIRKPDENDGSVLRGPEDETEKTDEELVRQSSFVKTPKGRIPKKLEDEKDECTDDSDLEDELWKGKSRLSDEASGAEEEDESDSDFELGAQPSVLGTTYVGRREPAERRKENGPVDKDEAEADRGKALADRDRDAVPKRTMEEDDRRKAVPTRREMERRKKKVGEKEPETRRSLDDVQEGDEEVQLQSGPVLKVADQQEAEHRKEADHQEAEHRKEAEEKDQQEDNDDMDHLQETEKEHGKEDEEMEHEEDKEMEHEEDEEMEHEEDKEGMKSQGVEKVMEQQEDAEGMDQQDTQRNADDEDGEEEHQPAVKVVYKRRQRPVVSEQFVENAPDFPPSNEAVQHDNLWVSRGGRKRKEPVEDAAAKPKRARGRPRKLKTAEPGEKKNKKNRQRKARAEVVEDDPDSDNCSERSSEFEGSQSHGE